MTQKFKKAVVLGMQEDELDPPMWRQLDRLVEKRVMLAKGDPRAHEELADADCVLVRFGVPVTAADLAAAPKLRYIGLACTATDRVDVAAAKQRSITVSNLKGYSTEAVAEFAIAAILDCCRGLEEGKRRTRSANYSELGIPARELRGSRFGILGLGSIGTRVGELALAFGADVRYWSRTRKKASEKLGMRYQDADALIAECDFISIHLSLAKETAGFLSAARIAKLKPGAVLVNTSPMELVDIPALAARLAKGDITFILDHSDVMRPEDLARLAKHSNCIIYPPIGYITNEARQRKQELFISNIRDFLAGKPSCVVE